MFVDNDGTSNLGHRQLPPRHTAFLRHDFANSTSSDVQHLMLSRATRNALYLAAGLVRDASSTTTAPWRWWVLHENARGRFGWK